MSMVEQQTRGNARTPIPRVRRPSYSEFQSSFVRKQKPVIVEGALDAWPASGKWTPEFFGSEWGDLTVRVDGEEFTMSDFVRRVKDPDAPAPYIKATKIDGIEPKLLDDLRPDLVYMKPNWLDGRFIPDRLSIRDDLGRGRRWELLFGKPGSTFPVLHWDVTHYHAFICQLYGKKSLIAYPPDQTEFLYPDDTYPNKSRIPVGRDFDPEEYPLFRHARGMSATLEPGDMLFIPGGWWHAVENVTVSIAVTSNAAERTNWKYVVRDVTDGRGTPLRAKAVAAGLYGVGLVRGAVETVAGGV